MPNIGKLAGVETAPFGTGSFGQVYRGQLTDGTPIILKVLRPNVMRYIRYDMRLLSVLSWFYSMLDRQKMLDFREINKEFQKTCKEEIDYLREIEVGDYFYRQYADHQYMVIPKTYTDMSNSKVIVQDYIDGLSVARLLSMQTQGVDARQYVREHLNSDLYTQIYTIGYELVLKALTGQLLHADPHPGNVVLLRDNRVALIDFGMTTQLKKNRMAFFSLLQQYKAFYNNEKLAIDEMLIAAMEFIAPKLYAAINSAEVLLGDKGGDSLLIRLRNGATNASWDRDSQVMLDNMLQGNRIMKTLFFVINKGNRFGLTIDLSAIILLKSIHSYMTLIGPFDKDALVMARVLKDAVEYGQEHLADIADSNPVRMEPAEAMEVLSNWFDKMSRNDPWLMQQIAGAYIE
jgi:serine/threonine protein kinase